jgi:hypothetical protein
MKVATDPQIWGGGTYSINKFQIGEIIIDRLQLVMVVVGSILLTSSKANCGEQVSSKINQETPTVTDMAEDRLHPIDRVGERRETFQCEKN